MNAKTRILQEAALRAADRGEPVYLGNSSGVVAVPGEPGRVWVTDQRGDVQKVWNVTVPNAPGVCVFIKRIDKRMQVTAMWDVYSNWIYPKIGPHNMLHEWGAAGTDIVRTPLFQPGECQETGTAGADIRVLHKLGLFFLKLLDGHLVLGDQLGMFGKELLGLVFEYHPRRVGNNGVKTTPFVQNFIELIPPVKRVLRLNLFQC